MSRSELEERLYQQMRLLSMEEGSTFTLPVREYHPFWCCEHAKRAHGRSDCWFCLPSERHEYAKPRNWRCDFAWPDRKLAIEVEGGLFTQGRHTRGSGFTKDLEKYNAITEAGWTLFRVSRREIKSGEALRIIERALKGESPALGGVTVEEPGKP